MAIIKKEDFGGGGTGLTLGSWNYDSNTDAPGTTPISDNTWRTDNATLASSIKLYIDDNDDDGTDWGAKLNVPDGSWISFSIDSSNQVHFKVQNATDGTGYWEYDILGVVVEGTIGNGAATSMKIDVGGTGDVEYIIIACSGESSDLTAATDVATFRMPFAATITEVRADVNIAPTGSTLIVDINEGGSTILSTKLSIDATETTSETAATPAVISDASIAENAEVSIDIDQIGASTPGAGLRVTIICTR